VRPFLSRRFPTLFLGLALLHLAFSFFVNPPGYLTYDSGTYHLMAKTFAETGSFVVRNGYEELPSPELVVAQLRVSGDHLASQYPEFLTVLVYPFYRLFGYRGFFVLNALAFLGVNLLIHRLAVRLFKSRRTGWLAVAVYSFGTFAWEYSHSSYPHLSSTLFILAAYNLLAGAVFERRARGAVWRCAAAGLVAGLAVGLRLDAVFAVPGLFLPLLFARPVRFRELAAVAAGLAPGLLFLSAVNEVKFDRFFPFTYGASGGYVGGLGWYLPVVVLGLLVIGFAFLFDRLPAERRRWGWIVAGVAVAVALLAAPGTLRHHLAKLADGTYQIVVDLRIRDLDIREPSLGRTPNGAMVYLGSVKKSLLQSCPYLAALPFLFLDARRSRRRLGRLLFLCLVPAAFVGVYSYLAWHGSVALNMRYLNPILPFTAILTAHFLRRLARGVSRRPAVGYGIALLLGLFLLFSAVRLSPVEQEGWFLTPPLVLAAGVVVAEALRRLGALPSLGRPFSLYLLVTALAWSGAVTFARDYPPPAAVRAANLTVARAMAPFVDDDSLIFSNVVDVCWGLLDDHRKIRIARPEADDFRTFGELARFHLERGRKVYMAYTPNEYRAVATLGFLDRFEARVLNVWSTGGRPSLVLLELAAAPTARTEP